LTDKSSDLKGQPLKTSLRVMMGGQQCSATAKAKSNGSSSADSAAGSPNPIANVAQAGQAAGKAIGSALGGLFHKKKTDDASSAGGAATTPDAASSTSPAPAAAPAAATVAAPAAAPLAPDPYAQLVQLASFTTETVAISTEAVAAGRFDVPPDWKKDVPKAARQGDDDFTCPKTTN
jgi:hypothetical protein